MPLQGRASRSGHGALEVGPVDRSAPAHQDRRHHLRREQAVLDDAGRRAEPGGQGRRVADRPRGSRRSRRRRGSAARRAARPGRPARSVARSPKESSSSGTGPCSASTGLDESAMTTKRSAAAARIFSRVCAPPPPLTSQPSGAIWSAPSMVMSKRSMLATGPPSAGPARARRARCAATWRRRECRATGAPAPGAGTPPSSRCPARRSCRFDQIRCRLRGDLLLPLDAHGSGAPEVGRGARKGRERMDSRL